MTEYNVTAELPIRNVAEHADDLLERLAAFHPAISTSPLGWAEAIITVHAESVVQAVAVAVPVLGEVVSLTVMTTEEFDRRPVAAERLPELLSVTEVAERLGVSRQAVLQRLDSGSLPGVKVGSTWVVSTSVI